MKKLVVFIPAYNEEKNIEKTISELKKLEAEFKENKLALSILVVNDGSTDKTLEIIKQIDGITIESHPYNRGLGATTKAALMKAYEMGADFAAKLDADFQHDPKDIIKVVLPLLNDEADICWGSRFKGKILYKMPLIRRWGNRFFTFLLNKVTQFNISDAQTGLMAFNRKYLNKFEIFHNYNPPQQLLIDAYYKNMRYTEVPVVFYPREEGDSFVNLKYPFKVLSIILLVILYANPLKIFGGMGLICILFSFLWLAFYFFKLLFHIRFLDISFISIFFFLSGLILASFGVLADLILKKNR